MENGYDYYGDQSYYAGDYMTDQPLYTTEPSPMDEEPLELPPEPEDSPYDDPVVRHLLSIKDEKYRNRMLSYLSENVRVRPVLHPVFVMLMIVLCFPVGLCMMYFGTRWGTFAKVVITLFTLAMAFAVYEILAFSGTIPTPSLVDTVSYIISQITSGEAPMPPQ